MRRFLGLELLEAPHATALNLGLLMRTLVGVGTPRGLKGGLMAFLSAFRSLIGVLERFHYGLLRAVAKVAPRPHPLRTRR